LDYGTSSGDTNFTSCANGNVTFTFGFSFPYQNSIYSSVVVSVNGLVYLNGSVLIGAFPISFCTNNTGMVFYRNVTNPADLTAVGSAVVSLYTNYTFNPTYAFVVTW
jgi:hypothetical protein